MAKKNGFVSTPVDMVAQPPAGYKGSKGVYNGEDQGAFAGYKRTSSPNAVPEKTYDGSMPATKKDVILPNALPKDKK
jgi:hypothetical protein